MIREKLIALRERRALLVARAEHQRESVVAFVDRAEAATAWFDRAQSLLHRAREHPVWVAAGVALLVATRPRKALKWLVTGFSVWRSWRSFRAALDRIAPAHPSARPAA